MSPTILLSLIAIISFLAFTGAKEDCDPRTRSLGSIPRMILQEHNRYRQLYPGIPDICYGSNRVDFTAESWAETLASEKKSSAAAPRTLGGGGGGFEVTHSELFRKGKVGENIAVGEEEEEGTPREEAVFTAIRDWFDPCNYLPVTELTAGDMERDERIGRCVQILTATNVECGLSGTVFVCQYDKPVNAGFPPLPKATNWEPHFNKTHRLPFDPAATVLQVRAPPAARFTLYLHFFTPSTSLNFSAADDGPGWGEMMWLGGCDSMIFGMAALEGRSFPRTWDTLVFTYNLTTADLSIECNGEHLLDYISTSTSHCNAATIQLIRAGGFTGVEVERQDGQYDVRFLAPVVEPLPLLERDDSIHNDELLPDVIFTDPPPEETEIEVDEERVIFPQIHVTFVEATKHQITVYLDRGEDFQGISTFQLILEPEDMEDSEAYKTTTNTWEIAKEVVKDEGELRVPYITAEFEQELPEHFVIGDGRWYGGFLNGPLLVPHRHARYSVRVRGVVEGTDGKKWFVISDILGDFEVETLGMAGAGLAAILILIVVGACYSARARKKRRLKKVKQAFAKLNDLVRDMAEADERAWAATGEGDMGGGPRLSAWEADEWWSSVSTEEEQLPTSQNDPDDVDHAEIDHYN